MTPAEPTHPVHRYGLLFRATAASRPIAVRAQREKSAFLASPPVYSNSRMRTPSSEQDAVMRSNTRRRLSTFRSHTLADGIPQKSKTLVGKGAGNWIRQFR
jgi:hypothetical protein